MQFDVESVARIKFSCTKFLQDRTDKDSLGCRAHPHVLVRSLFFRGAPAMVVLSFCPAGGHAFFVAVRAWFYSDLGGDVTGN